MHLAPRSIRPPVSRPARPTRSYLGAAVVTALLTALATMGLTGAADAAGKSVPVPTRRVLVGSISLDGCAETQVQGLSATGKVSIRSTPSAKGREIDRLPNDMFVYVCEQAPDSSNYVGIIYSRVGHGEECGAGVDSPGTKPRRYSGPCWSGWVSSKYLRGAAS
jgi:hypothetical protein